MLKDKKARLPLLLLAVGILLMLLPLLFGAKETENRESGLEEYKQKLEEELKELCSDVDGVGKCRVSITFERGEQNTYKGSSLIETKPPKILGITVICKGGDSDAVRARLVEMFSALFDIGSNRIAVLKLNS